MNKLTKFKHDLRWSVIYPSLKKVLKPKSKVIDIGAGDMYFSHLIQKTFDCQVVATEIVDNKSDYNIIKAVVKGTKLPFPDNSFDYAIFSEVLHHIPKEEQVASLEEAKRVARNLIIIEDKPGLITSVIDVITNKLETPKPLAFRKSKDWIEMLSRLNFAVDTFYLQIPFYYPVKHFLFLARGG